MEHKIDGWANALTGLGVKGKDKIQSSVPAPVVFSRAELDDLFRADDIARRVVTKLPREAFREGYEIQISDQTLEAQKTWLLKKIDRLQLDEKLRKAWRDARLYGGAAIVLGINDGRRMDQPVDEFNINDILWAHSLDRWQIPYQDINRDITSQNYGNPNLHTWAPIEVTSLPSGETTIHRSRLIIFDGNELSDVEYRRNAFWHASVLEPMYRPLLNFNTAHDSAATLVADFAQAVFSMKDLTELLSADREDLVVKRLSMIDRCRSVVNAAVIEEGESFTRVSTPISGLPELLEAVSVRLVAASEMPHNLILGDGAKGGLGAEGDTENRDWYDFVSQQQETYLRPRHERLLRLLQLCKNNPTGGKVSSDIEISYKPLWQMDEQETVNIRKVQAETDNLYIAMGVLDPEEVAQSRFGGAEYSIETNLMEERQPLQLPAPITDSFDLYEGIDFTLPIEVRDIMAVGIQQSLAVPNNSPMTETLNQARDIVNGATIAPTTVLSWLKYLTTMPAPEAQGEGQPISANLVEWNIRGGEFGASWLTHLLGLMKQAEVRNARV